MPTTTDNVLPGAQMSKTVARAKVHRVFLMAGFLCLVAVPLGAQDRAAKVRNDRERFIASDQWIYNDWEKGVAKARERDKPLLVVLRCIP